MEYKETNVVHHDKSIWTNAIEASIIGLVILVPIVFYPWCITVFIPAKEMIAEVLVILGLMFWGFKIIDKGKLKFISTPINLSVLSFILICVLSLIWSNNIFASLRDLRLFWAGLLLYFITINNVSNQRQVNRIVNILLIVGALFGIYGIFQYIGIDFPIWSSATGRNRVLGLFGNVNFFAEYLIVPLPIAVSLFLVSRNKFKKILLLIASLAMGISLIVTFTRGSYLGLGVSLIFMFLLFIISRGKNFIKNNKKFFIAILVAITIITFLFVIPTPLNKSGTVISQIKNRISVTQLTQDSSIKRRIATWKFTVLMIKDHPLLGSGIGTYKYNTLRYQAEFFGQGENRSLYPHGFADKAHNEYLQLWAEMGIVGLGIFIWLIISYFSYGLKMLRKIKDEYRQGIVIGLMGAVVAVLVDGIFGFPLHLPATVMLFWLAIGLTVVLGLTEDGYSVNASSLRSDYIRKIEKMEIKNKKRTSKQCKKTVGIPILKPVLYICVVLLAFFLSTIAVRPFIARTYWFRAEKETNRSDIDLNETINNYFEVLKWDPYLGEVYYTIGKILMNNGFYTPALEYFKKAEKYVDLPGLPLGLARIYINKDMLDEASIKLKQAITYQDSEKLMLPLYSELGNIYLKLKQYEQAKLVFEDALKINADFIDARYGLARAYLNQGLFTEALIEFQKVIELAPDSIEADYAKKVIQQLKKDMDNNE